MKIEIPKELWVVKKADSDLAYVTHLEDNEACKKRQDTGRHWAKQYGKPEGIESTHTNELLAGYKVLQNVSRWSTSNVVWRILDPRGFEFEIYSGNMMEILQCSRVEKGVILDKCLIGRESGKNVLLPEGSEPYLNAQSYTNLKEAAKETKIRIKDVTPGSLVTLKDGEIYTYLGAFYILKKKDETVGYTKQVSFEVAKAKEHFFIRGDNVYNWKTPTVIGVEPKESSEDYQKIINSKLPWSFCGALAGSKEAFKLALVEPKDELDFRYSDHTYVYGSCVLSRQSYNSEGFYTVRRIDLKDNLIEFPDYYITAPNSWYNRHGVKQAGTISEQQVDLTQVQELVVQINDQNIPLRYIY